MTTSDQNGPEKAPGSPADGQTGPDGQSGTPKAPDTGKSANSGEGEKDPDTFPREYVENLRKESKGYREKASKVDALTSRLVLSMASANGKLADPTDLPINDALMGEDGYPDREKVDDAIEDLIAKKPHLRSKRPSGDVGQGPRDDKPSGSWLDAARTRI